MPIGTELRTLKSNIKEAEKKKDKLIEAARSRISEDEARDLILERLKRLLSQQYDNLLQTIARVNRVAKGKQRGYIVDYIGLANHLKEALSIYGGDDQGDIDDSLQDITVELPVLDDRYRRLLNLFKEGGVKDIEGFVKQVIRDAKQSYQILEAAIVMMGDLKRRANFEVYLKQFMQSMDIILPRVEAHPYLIPVKRFGYFCLLSENGELQNPDAAFKAFYKAKGQTKIANRVSHYADRMGVAPSGVRILELQNRWASCTPEGRLNFHWKCMMAPPTVIDYIVVHELAHLQYLNHTKAFWDQVDKVLPDYRDRKEWLRVNGAGMDL